MKRYTRMCILVLISIVAVTVAAFSMGCTDTGTTDDPLDVDDTVVSGTVFSEEANSSEISLKMGDSIVLKLNENPSTGYSWDLSLPEGIVLVKDEFVGPDEPMPGAGGVHEWTLKASSEGNYQINAIYKMSWENVTGNEDTFTMNVVVLADSLASDDTGEEYIVGTAVVDDVQIMVMESFPLQISVTAIGNLPDGCTFIDEENIETVNTGNGFDIALKTKRPKDVACTQALVPFEVNIPLDVYGLEKGVYTVNVNGVTGTFEFIIDNVME
ncbi:protease inhibitor I42 family protein [Methanococcoides burtonii]|uniref:Chagasin peptidase inhibitor I42-domain protein n=1 Tax=Methanococcoides burtonii (strain DSM 6242 / NBRC 107633 / OCM 468 / ACE-M) TaxID=259564 RepID=Q12W54_METBU|nr:protease inhibitor I42 family protein [Methanococcoides burtonii]ABE52322.1 Chagasin peptidase inhibitor I42-domain protein [Methanococcoides burtonii DSM 6242]